MASERDKVVVTIRAGYGKGHRESSMSINRKQFGTSDLAFFTAFDRWGKMDALARASASPAIRPNIITLAQSPEEVLFKRKHYRPILDGALKSAQGKIDLRQDWDVIHWSVFDKMQGAALYYLYTGDKKAIAPAVEALSILEQCKREYWSFSSCIGVLDMDLRTAEVALSLTMMKCCMGDALDGSVLKRLSTVIVERCLRPGLEAERNKTYPWMHSRANWRIILCGCFAMGGMAFAEDFPEYPELIAYGLEAMLTCLATGDKAGGWNEGPGYWDYGLGYAVRFASALRIFTGGAVDIYRHPFLRKTGDFRLFMHTQPNQLWNWSDVQKKTGPSITLMGLARAYRNPSYQWMSTALGVQTIGQLFMFDPFVEAVRPPSRITQKFFPGLGVLTWRNGFGPRDTYLGIKGGDIPHFNHHCHMDFGNLVIHAEGRELLAELDHWAYPYEGRKDPKDKGNKPGYYDRENKRWMRWDFDSVSATGHNVVTLEGIYPKARLGIKARFLKIASGADHEVAVIDSTSAYRPLATRVRRYIVLLWPDVVLLVDEVRAREPVHARVQYHPADRVTLGSDTFTFTNGPACLLGTSLYPRVQDQLVIGCDERKTNYMPPSGIVEKINRYVYIENLCRKPRLVFVSALQFGRKGMEPAACSLQGDPAKDDRFAVCATRGPRTTKVGFDLAGVVVDVDG